MKLIIILAIVLGAGALFGTRHETPFLRWGIVATLAGLAVMMSSVFFTFTGVKYGIILAIVGICVYYYGRLARREQLFVSKPK